MESNGNVICSKIDTVEITAIPPSWERSHKWESLYADLCLRLEQTPKSLALQCEFASNKQARHAHSLLHRRFVHRHGAEYVNLVVRQKMLFVYRGPNYIRDGRLTGDAQPASV